MEVNSDWDYKESLFFIDYIKNKYEDVLLSFCVFGGNKDYFEKVYSIKKSIYSLKFEEWKKDKLWEYLNNDIKYDELWGFV